MKKFIVMNLIMFVSSVGIQANAAVVYEGFDYTEGTTIGGQGTATDGWAGAWVDAGNSSYPQEAVAGLTFANLLDTGGAAQRQQRFGKDAMNRQISAAAQAALTADGTTTWFSVLMNPGSNISVFDGGGYATNSYMTFILGDAELVSGEGNNAATITGTGNAVGVSYAGSTGGQQGHDDMRLQGVTYKDGVLTENIDNRIIAGGSTILVVGKVEWAANGTNDVVSLYNVLDPTAPLPTAFSVMEEDLDQTAFNVVGVGDAQTSVIDEIRFGTSLADVTPIPEPATMGLLALGGLVLARRRHS